MTWIRWKSTEKKIDWHMNAVFLLNTNRWFHIFLLFPCQYCKLLKMLSNDLIWIFINFLDHLLCFKGICLGQFNRGFEMVFMGFLVEGISTIWKRFCWWINLISIRFEFSFSMENLNYVDKRNFRALHNFMVQFSDLHVSSNSKIIGLSFFQHGKRKLIILV